MVPTAPELSHAISLVIAGLAIAVGVEFDELSFGRIGEVPRPHHPVVPPGCSNDRFESALKLAYCSFASASGKHGGRRAYIQPRVIFVLVILSCCILGKKRREEFSRTTL